MSWKPPAPIDARLDPGPGCVDLAYGCSSLSRASGNSISPKSECSAEFEGWHMSSVAIRL